MVQEDVADTEFTNVNVGLKDMRCLDGEWILVLNEPVINMYKSLLPPGQLWPTGFSTNVFASSTRPSQPSLCTFGIFRSTT